MFSHIPTANVLVVAPDADLRQSLAFVFEASGFAARTCTRWPPEYELGQFDAIILDEIGVSRSLYGDSHLVAHRGKIILLAGRVGPVPDIPHAHLVRKPLLDSHLLDIVRSLIPPRAAASR